MAKVPPFHTDFKEPPLRRGKCIMTTTIVRTVVCFCRTIAALAPVVSGSARNARNSITAM